MSLDLHLNKILIIDFGSQFTQLIVRRIRELGVYSELVSHKKIKSFQIKSNTKGIILSGGPLNVYQLNNKPQILRLGGIEISKINKVLGTKLKFIKNKKLIAPGQDKVHYSPGIPMRLNIKKPKLNEAFILIKKRKKSYKNYY